MWLSLVGIGHNEACAPNINPNLQSRGKTLLGPLALHYGSQLGGVRRWRLVLYTYPNGLFALFGDKAHLGALSDTHNAHLPGGGVGRQGAFPDFEARAWDEVSGNEACDSSL